MRTIETSIQIDATPHTVWSIMDDLQHYPDWNKLTSDLAGRTTVGSIVRGTLTKGGNSPAVPLSPTITTIVGAREFRWLTKVPGFHAEHYFLLRPTGDGGTELIHNEDFDGPVAEERWEGIQASSPPAYDQFNRDLKHRAEEFRDASVSLHPVLEQRRKARVGGRGATLQCLCAETPVSLAVTKAVYHNHLCGCSKCWKPAGAAFAQIAVVASDGIQVLANGDKLAVIDESQSIRRHACRKCGAHLHGEVADSNHHFYGIAFIHPELADRSLCGAPEFAGFVSSIIETGTSPSLMSSIRRRLAEAGIPAFDAFSPELMDIIAWHKCKVALNPIPTV